MYKRLGIIFIHLLLIAIYAAKAQSVGGTDFKKILHGPWYTQKGGQLQMAFYPQGVIFKNSFWKYDTISQAGDRITVGLMNETGQIEKLTLKLTGVILYDYTAGVQPVICLNNLKDCQISHHLAALENPELHADSVHVNFLVENPFANYQISVQVHQLITGETSTYYQGVESNGFVQIAIPVVCPVQLSIRYPFGNSTAYLLPGMDFTQIVTEDGKTVFGGSGALLSQEMNLFIYRDLYFKDPSSALIELKDMTPESYTRYIEQLGNESTQFVDSLYRSKLISPLTYQVQQLNIRFTLANDLLNYNYVKQVVTGNSQKTTLPIQYFDFLKGLDKNIGFIAPAYWDFIESMRKNDSHADHLPLSTPTLIEQSLIPVDSITVLLQPVSQNTALLSTTQIGLLDSLRILQKNPAAKSNFIESHKTAMQSITQQFYYVYLFSQLSESVMNQIKKITGWQPGITTDLIISSNLAIQFYNNSLKLPATFYDPHNNFFNRPFISQYIQDYIKRNDSSTFISPSAPSSELQWSKIDQRTMQSIDTIKKGNLTLIFASNYKDFSQQIKTKMQATFFTVYPIEMAEYNSKAPKTVTFVMDKNYLGVAATADTVIRFNPQWFLKNPEDIDVVTHEAMHVVQGYYASNYQPRWITEGIADYVRLTMGLNNKVAGWAVPDYTTGQSYTDSYRIAARFFYWLQEYKKQDLIQLLDKVMRSNNYTEDFWKQNTGKDLNSLWQEYTANPVIHL